MRVANYPFWRVAPAQSGREGAYTLPIMLPATVGPEGAPHLMGGVALAAAMDAMELSSGQPILSAHVQFLSPTHHAEELHIQCEQYGGGQSIGQWYADAHVNGRPTHRFSASLGAREPCDGETFIAMPNVPAPDECEPSNDPRWGAEGSLFDQIEGRTALKDLDKGYIASWVRNTGGLANDSGWLALISDLFLGQHPRSYGGASLDATFRFIQPSRPGWVLCVTQMGAVDRGVIHGSAQYFGEDGKLLALSSQTGVLPRIPLNKA